MFVENGKSSISSGQGFGHDLRILDGIASWCGALHGSMPLSDAIAALGQALGATTAVISRDTRHDSKPRLVADWDGLSGQQDFERIRRPFARDVLGVYYNKMRGGSVWFLSDTETGNDFEPSSGLSHWRLARGIEDIIVVALEATGIQHDYLEFHFARSLTNDEKIETERMLPTLVRAWVGRQTGLVTQAQMDERLVRARAAAQAQRIKPEESILGVSNPARLSRAEFRVCLLLSRGLSVKAVVEELGLSEATVRSHLRSIYSKTGCHGLAELVYRMLSNDSERGDLSRSNGIR